MPPLVVDVFSDEQHLMLRRIQAEDPACFDLYKNASYDDPATLSKHAFADAYARRFPIHSPEHAVLSYLYAEKQAGVDPAVRQRIHDAVEAYGVRMPEQAPTAQKEAQESVRYLLPQKQAMPVRTADDVRDATDAVRLKAGQLKVASLAEASVNALMIGRDLGMSVDELHPDVYKYAGVVVCDAGLLLDQVDARAAACTDPQHATTYKKIAASIEKRFPVTGMITSRNTLVKIAETLEDLDSRAGLERFYGHMLDNPLKAVFNMNKFAEPSCLIAGVDVPLSKLMALPDETIDEFVGDGASASKMDPEAFKSMIDTLPADVHRAMMANLKAYLT